ncbi:group II intron reverse transcriptase/maturase [Paraliobacillus quinghaiensis]|uniref:Group II intron reverse transcriptase/maturase n=1 Tax=Paraliobacillus quinghaiensis TaxID=470815 RepID=A0A917TFA6_9BACI|nr:group II intron reverse transcriptase/maturase [Paraliobacillus quinghaiensis]GGM20222.1 group II intron reverse transcriptase/maturase [Paraliobacillus quinghaiensis]
METKLNRITELAKTDENLVFTSLVHLLNKDNLKQCHHQLPKGKAAGVNGTTKQMYEENLENNIENLVERLKKMAYRPVPVKRTYIGKPGSIKKRPLGIPEFEDKIVQSGITRILNAIYENDFLDCSFGFRPQRNCHDALKILNVYIERRKTNYVVDADIKGFFDHVSHDWMMKFLRHRINDPKLLRIIARFLKGGYMEEGKYFDTDKGTPQGGVISPILANIYLHYVLDLWFEKVVKKKCKGQAYMVRYADDFVCCFQYKEDANLFYDELIQRLSKFQLEIAEEKTKIISFGPFALRDANRNGKKKPSTFDFLGFTHYCGESKKGNFRVKRKSSKKKVDAKLKQHKAWLKAHRTMDIKNIMLRIHQSLVGYYNYYCITDNYKAVKYFLYHVELLLFKWMNRRSQRKSFSWDKFRLFLQRYPLPKPTIKGSIYNLRQHISYTL